MSENIVVINGVTYKKVDPLDERKYVVIRSDRAGVFAGYLKSKSEGHSHKVVTMNECRRLHHWEGASSCTQLAIDGVKKPEKCRFTAPIQEQEIMGVIEILPCTDIARESIKRVSVWEAI